ncbi:MAG: multiheme c-type cytochrome [Spirochaetota bacterium]
MINTRLKVFLLIAIGFLVSAAAFAAGKMELPLFGAEYAGSANCKSCHEDIYKDFKQSGHGWKLNKVVNGTPPQYPFTKVPGPPEGYTWNDVTYVIGGYNWKARFIGKDGFIITGPKDDSKFLNQYNFANPVVGTEAGWVTYNSGKEVPYNCGSCHTTGYSAGTPDSHQDGLPGIVGTWAEPGITCEACHGPGSLHVKNPRGVALKVDRSSAACGKCHIRGSIEEVNANAGFIEHHEQYEELFQSKHVTLDCVLCHNPHKGVVALRQAKLPTTRTSCENCHFEKVKNQASPAMAAMGVKCIDCHMPRITKSAVGNAAKFTGDIRTHLMSIDWEQIGQFTADGKKSLSQLGLNFACRNCHVDGGTASVLSDEQLKQRAFGYHKTLVLK